MPTYEMPLLVRTMKKPGTVETLKRAANVIFSTGGFIRKMENWGFKQLPCKARSHGRMHRDASHFMIAFDAPPKFMSKIYDECRRDVDIVRLRIYSSDEPMKKKCTFDEEMLPAPYRPSVVKLMEKAKKKRMYSLDAKHAFKYNSGLSYYPFVR